MSYDLFVSYAHVDDRDGWVTAFVSALQEEHARFTPRPLRIFFDCDEIRTGDDWEHRILRGLSESRVMLAVLSPAYFASEYCRLEWEHYVEYELARAMPGEGITPIYTATVPGLTESSAAAALDRWTADLRRRQYLDVRSWREEGPAALQRNDVRSRLELLDQQINDRLERAERGDASPTTVPAHNRNFVGRLEELRQLKASLLHGQLGAIAAVQGLGGMGKSALAFEYAHAFAADYPGGRFLINAAGVTDFRSAIVQLAPYRDIALTPEEREDVEASFARVRLAFEQGPRCLLLLDNVDDPSVLSAENRAAFLPGGPQVHVLVTTRLEPDRLPGAACVTLGELPLAEGLQLLERHRPPRNEAEWHAAREIVQTLGGHPLFLEVVAVYLWQNPEVGYVAYLEQRIRGKWIATLDEAAASGAVTPSRHAPTQCGALLDPTLASLTPPEMLALEYASLLPPDRVPLSWLRRVVGEEFPEASAGPAPGHADPWRRIERRLNGLRLLVRAESSQVARMHRVVQEVVRSRFGSEPVNPRRWNLRDWLASVFIVRRSRRARRTHDRLMNELVSLVFELGDGLLGEHSGIDDLWQAEPMRDFAWQLFAEEDVDAGDLGYMASRVLSRAGRYGDDRRLLSKALDVFEAATPRDLHKVAMARGSLATAIARIGNLREARDLYRQAIAEWPTNLVGREHDRALAGLYSSLAVVESHLGNRQAVTEARRQSISLRGNAERLDDHNSLLEAALLARDEGHREQSRADLVQVLALQEEALGPVHLDVADTCFNLAQLDQDLGRPQQALPLFQRALDIEQQVLTANHPRISTTYTGLGRCELALRQLDAAREHFQCALNVLERVFPDGHWQYGTNYILMSMVEEAAGNLQRAHDLAVRSVDAFSRFLPEDHNEILTALQRRASCERRLGLREEARETGLRLLERIDRASAAAPNLVGLALNELGVAELELGRNEDAHAHLSRAAQIEFPGDRNSQLHRASIQFNLAVAEQRASRLPEARTAMRAALQIRRQLVAPDHASIRSCVDWLSQFDPEFTPPRGVTQTSNAPTAPAQPRAIPPTPPSPVSPRPSPGSGTTSSQAQVEQARQQIMENVRQVQRLVQDGSSLDHFADVLLEVTGKSLAAHACRFWLRSKPGDWRSLSEWSASGGSWPGWSAVPIDEAWREAIISETACRMMRVPIANPTNGDSALPGTVLVIGRGGLLASGLGVALEVCQRGNSPPQAEAGYCQFVDRMAQMAGTFLTRHPPVR